MMKNKRLVKTLMLLLFSGLAWAIQSPEPTPEFIRYVSQTDHKALQVSVVSYQPRTGGDVRVDLVGAVHVADKQYYQDLNELFTQYDVVLYELVAPEGTQIPKGGGTQDKSVLSNIQLAMKDMLGLSFQMEEVDYTPAHFVHADFTPQEFSESMKNKGESIFSMIFNLWRAGLSQQLTGQASSNDFDLLMALMAEDRQNALKTLMAKELSNAEGMMSVLEGSEGSTLVAERNKKALQVLTSVMKQDKQTFAIFYGAAHLSDFHTRLLNDFDMVPVSTRWIDAWKLD